MSTWAILAIGFAAGWFTYDAVLCSVMVYKRYKSRKDFDVCVNWRSGTDENLDE